MSRARDLMITAHLQIAEARNILLDAVMAGGAIAIPEYQLYESTSKMSSRMFRIGLDTGAEEA